MIPVTGATRFIVMLGDPIAQVKTPTVFQEWATANGQDIIIVPMRVSSTDLSVTLQAIRGWANCCGAVITYPHKQAAAAAVDHASRAVRMVGACNVIRREPDGGLSGDITDGAGFVAALRSNGFDPLGQDIQLIGAGGAGSAIAFALLEAGTARLVIRDQRPQQAETLCFELKELFPKVPVLTEVPANFDCALICNATPVGMGGDAAHPWPLETLAQTCLVADIVPDPPMTAWLNAAEKCGHKVQTGPDMVKAQLPAVVGYILNHSQRS